MAFIQLESIFAGLATLVVFYAIRRIIQNQKLPPGPWGLPIVGILPFLNQSPDIEYQGYFKKYGKICSFYMGTTLTIIINDYQLLKEAFVRQGEIFAGRPKHVAFRVFPEDNGIVTSDGQEYKEFKAFIVSTLKEFGAVRIQFEATVKHNADHFVQYLKSIEGRVVDILEPLGLSIAQTYCQLLLGKRMEPEDPLFKELISLCYQEHRIYNNGARMYFPWAKRVPLLSKYIGEDEIRKVRTRLDKIIDGILKDYESTYEEGSRETYMHSWLSEDRKRKLKDPKDDRFGRHALLHNMNIVFSAGYETTTTTLRWVFLFLLNHPEIQDKIIEELDEVVGHDRLPSLDDCPRLPFLMATIHETHRYATIVPLGVAHRNIEATTLGGYYIPKSTIIIPNIYSIHIDPVFFPDPFEFKPERFIDEKGKFIKSEYVIPFGLGKRQCPGERMAQIEIFTYLSYLFQHFRLEKASYDQRLIENDRSCSISSTPANFNLKFVDRFK